jgi:hypothetical protein
VRKSIAGPGLKGIAEFDLVSPARDTKDNCEEKKENYSNKGGTEENAEGGRENK